MTHNALFFAFFLAKFFATNRQKKVEETKEPIPGIPNFFFQTHTAHTRTTDNTDTTVFFGVGRMESDGPPRAAFSEYITPKQF